MRILLLFSIIALLSNCTSVEIAKELTKATKSIKTSIDNIVKSSADTNQEEIIEEKNVDKKIIDQEIANLEKEKNVDKKIIDQEIIDQEIANLEKEKKEKEKIIKEQKKKTKINFLGKNFNEIKLIVGEPILLRTDGNSKTARFDNNFCQLFLFSNAKTKNFRVEYFEIRNKEGKLIINQKKIEKCYKNFKLI